MRISEGKIAFGILLFFGASIVVAQAQTPYRKMEQPQQRVISNPPVTESSTIGVEKAESFTKNPPQLGDSPGVPRVPDVVGLFWVDAEVALVGAGFKFKTIYEKQPDPSVLYGHVRATVPAAGSLAPEGRVEILIPRAASRLGTGTLALIDLDRWDGFDLDQGQYEQILRGADIVLRKHGDDPQLATNGDTFYIGHGLYIEPSDGAFLASLETAGKVVDADDLGTALYVAACEAQLKKGRAPGVEIADKGAVICVRTSLGELSVVQFRHTDNPGNDLADYKFHYALFPPQMVAPTRPSHISGRVHN